MAKASSNFVCQQCGYVSPQFLGRCPNCDSWNSFVETATVHSGRAGRGSKNNALAKPVRLTDIQSKQIERISTGISELDRVLGGGIVPGMAVLVAGEPGIGKSTLLLELADKSK